MHLVVVGLNHRTAPIELRERIAFPDRELPEALQSLRSHAGLVESAILSTCNRTELYAAVPHPGHDKALAQFLSSYHHVPDADLTEHLYTRHDAESIRHLFRVSSGIDSLVLGEPQVLRQVRDAFAAATEAGAAGPLLNGLFRAAIATGRRARTETDIGRGGFSVGHAAVDLARSIFGSLSGATILLLGAGKMSELTARHLVASGVKVVLVANRTHEKARALADKLGGQAIHYDAFPEALLNADIVISSTASPHPIIHKEELSPVMRKRRGRPLFFIDIALPRDIDPAASDLDNVFLYDIDDLQSVVEDMAKERSGEISRVEAVIEEETAKFASWWRALDAAPLVTQLRDKHEQIRQAELARLRNQLPDLSDRAWQCIEAATRSMLTQVGRDPIQKLKAASSQEDAEASMLFLDTARELLGLGETRCPVRHEPGKSSSELLDGSDATLPDDADKEEGK